MAVDLDEYLAALKASGLTPAQQAQERQVFFDQVIAASPEYKGLPSTERQALWKEVVGGTTPPTSLGGETKPFLARTQEAAQRFTPSADLVAQTLSVLNNPQATPTERAAARNAYLAAWGRGLTKAFLPEHALRAGKLVTGQPVRAPQGFEEFAGGFFPGFRSIAGGLGADIGRAVMGGPGEILGELAGYGGSYAGPGRGLLKQAPATPSWLGQYLRGKVAPHFGMPTFQEWLARARGKPVSRAAEEAAGAVEGAGAP